MVKDDNKKCQDERTEEVQAIIDRMPVGWTRWVVLVLCFVMGGVLAISYIVQYPDTVDGQISVTAKTAPVRLVSSNSGRVIVLIPNRTHICSGEYIAYLETGASFQDVFILDSLLLNTDVIPPPDSLLLGDLSSEFYSYSVATLTYIRLKESDAYPTLIREMENTICSDEAILKNMNAECKLREKNKNEDYLRLKKDSVLLSVGGISSKEFEDKAKSYRSVEEDLINYRNTILSQKAQISKNKIELQRISIEQAESLAEAMATVISTKSALKSSIQRWKEKNVFVSPVDGELEYLGFIRDNDFIQSGEEVFSIIPNQNETIGEVIIPTEGAGKVELGQNVNVKMTSFPYDEYGYLVGVVSGISRMKSMVQLQSSNAEAYMVTVTFPNGLVTNYGKTLPLDFESSGTAEIITRQKRLIMRLFDNLKSKTVK